LREVIRKEAAAERRREKCKGMDTHKKSKSPTEILKKSVTPIKRLAKIFEEIERGH
jgi:hypothetical protein